MWDELKEGYNYSSIDSAEVCVYKPRSAYSSISDGRYSEIAFICMVIT